MLQRNIAKCYDEIVEDPSLLWLFLEKECMLVWELLQWGALQFRIILERLFAHIASPDIWGKTQMEFITHTSWKICMEATPVVILITDGVGEEYMVMATTFCHHNQVKMEAPDALCALCQCNSLEPSVVVVRRYTSTPYIPWGTSCFLYWDVGTLWGASSVQFPLDWLHLCGILPFLGMECLLPCEEGEVGLKLYPFSWELLWKSSKEEHCLSDPVLLSIPLLALHPHLEESTQTGGGLGLHPTLKLLQDTNQARAQLECELVQETQELVLRYNNK